MDSRKLTYFLKICETGSIARAADALFISQQALSKALDSLEQELGVPLFIRSPMLSPDVSPVTGSLSSASMCPARSISTVA